VIGRARRRIAILSAVAFVVAPSVAARSSSYEMARTCATADLRIRLIHSGVAAGTVGGYLAFTNLADTPCRLSGWPKLVAITASGTTATAVRRRTTMFGPRPTTGVPVVTLQPGKRADAVFTAGDNPRPGYTRCPPPFRHLRVTPPGNLRSVVLSAWLPYYAQFLPSCTDIEISFVVPASALYRG
jgi:hypothetical protein